MPHKLQLLKRHQRTKANQKLQISGCSGHASTSLPFCMHHDLHVFRSFFFFIIRAGTKSRRFNEDCQTSQKPIIAFISVLELWMVLIDQNELPQPNEKEGGREGGRKWKSKRERENPGGILCLSSLGAFSVLVECCMFLWQAYLLSSTYASLSNQMKSQRRSSLIQPKCACSYVAHTSS